MITLWHNPRCSKSRAALALLETAGVPVTLRRYLDDPPTEAELRAVQTAPDRPTIDMLRRGEPEFKALGLASDSSDAALFAAMAAHPRLIERPIAISGPRARIGRPPEAVLDLL